MEDNIELILQDQEKTQVNAVDILTIYISHLLKHLENLYRQRGVYDLMRDTHFVFTAPASWSERECIRLLSDAAKTYWVVGCQRLTEKLGYKKGSIADRNYFGVGNGCLAEMSVY
ncbi:hypothetical protein CHS0354_032401 [Potamilus streckersoni]|uniref:Uncharacterized protein n=1 Tax=Potamilus streckersoni TaxID=2493646 RepID=A0AAE0TGQ6_9BIVA|nr:hypothetical protein CHS0354_032401 [Potamilus streckersoni]